MRMNKRGESGQPCFIEVNPLAGMHPSHSDLPMLALQNGISYDQLMSMILDAARERLGLDLDTADRQEPATYPH